MEKRTRGGLTLTERNKLIIDNLRVVYHIVLKSQYRGFAAQLGTDEAVQVGSLELVKRSETYDPRKAVSSVTGQAISFGTYAFRAIGRAICDAVKRKLPRQGDSLLRFRPSRFLSPVAEAILHEQEEIVRRDRERRRKRLSRRTT